MRRPALFLYAVMFFILVPAVCWSATYDVLIRSGQVYDGSGQAPYTADVAIEDDRVAAIGQLEPDANLVLDARGLAVAPGFINMLSWANESLIYDGRSQSEIRQGVTLEILGEGSSMGPLNEAMRQEMIDAQGDIKYPVEWTTLAEFLDFLVERGVSTNIASNVGAATVRVHVLGYEDRQATPAEIEQMCALVEQAMQEGAVGLSSALIYAPGCYANTDELIALAKVVGTYDGLYLCHLRSEGDRLLEGLEELITTARRADVRAEAYHMKAAGQANWPRLDAMIARIEAARAEGLPITTDMYTYTAGATGLDAAMPPWVQAGGHDAWVARLKDPEIRKRVVEEMRAPAPDWESLLLLAGSAERVLLVEFKNEKLRNLTGKTLAEVAQMRGTSPEDTAIDLVIEDDSRVGTVYFLMSDENVVKQIKQPWVSFCSDSASQAPEGVFLESNPHPRAYGCFARLLGRYVREEKVIPLAEAIRRLTSLPAANLKLNQRGRLAQGYFADVVVFDPNTIIDHATYAKPHQYATGMRHVFVNGTLVLRDGAHTNATPGRVVRGPGYRP